MFDFTIVKARRNNEIRRESKNIEINASSFNYVWSRTNFKFKSELSILGIPTFHLNVKKKKKEEKL